MLPRMAFRNCIIPYLDAFMSSLQIIFDPLWAKTGAAKGMK